MARDEWEAALLRALERGRSKHEAARLAGVSPRTVRYHAERDPRFREAIGRRRSVPKRR